MRAMATKRWPKEVLTSGGRCRPYREINFSCCVGFITRRISVGNVFPFSGKISVVRTVWEWHANSDNDFGIATQRPVNAKSFVRLTVVRHVRFPSIRSNVTPIGTSLKEKSYTGYVIGQIL